MSRNKLKIIYYHTVSDESLEYFPKENTQSIKNFRKQVKYFKKNYNIISLDDALHKVQNNELFSNNLVITTDDGFKENYTVIAPVLDEFKLTFTSFLCNDLIDNKSFMWRNILFYLKSNISQEIINVTMTEISSQYGIEMPEYNEDIMSWSLRVWPYELKDHLSKFFWDKVFDFSIEEYLNEKKPYLNSNQIREMINNGFSIGSHSKSHPFFENLNYPQAVYETVDAANELEERFGVKINSFSFPFERPKKYDNSHSLMNTLKDRFKVVLGINDLGMNHEYPGCKWERTSMEFGYYFSLLNLYTSPLREKLRQNF